MMILVIGDGAATAHALTAAQQLGGDEIHVLNLPANHLAEPISQVILTLDGYDAIVAPATSTGKPASKISSRPQAFHNAIMHTRSRISSSAMPQWRSSSIRSGVMR